MEMRQDRIYSGGCPTGKRMYATRKRARLSMKRHPEWNATRAYRCGDCANFHLTSSDASAAAYLRDIE